MTYIGWDDAVCIQSGTVTFDTAPPWVTDTVIDGCRKCLEETLPGFPTEMLMIGGTYTHTAPDHLPHHHRNRLNGYSSDCVWG